MALASAARWVVQLWGVSTLPMHRFSKCDGRFCGPMASHPRVRALLQNHGLCVLPWSRSTAGRLEQMSRVIRSMSTSAASSPNGCCGASASQPVPSECGGRGGSQDANAIGAPAAHTRTRCRGHAACPALRDCAICSSDQEHERRNRSAVLRWTSERSATLSGVPLADVASRCVGVH